MSFLLLHQFDAPILGSSVFAVVRGQRSRRPVALRAQARRRNAVFRGQHGDDRIPRRLERSILLANAEDIGCCLEGRAVLARKGTLSYRAANCASSESL